MTWDASFENSARHIGLFFYYGKQQEGDIIEEQQGVHGV